MNPVRKNLPVVLTPGEMRILLLTIQGQTSCEAADALYISRRTVDFHKGNILVKVGARSMQEVITRFCEVTLRSGCFSVARRGKPCGLR